MEQEQPRLTPRAAKILWIDIETTGIDPARHGIIQIAALIEINGEVIDEFEMKFQPHEGAEIDHKALDVTGTTLQELGMRTTSRAAYELFNIFLCKHIDKFDRNDKAYPAGYNVRFDLDFVERWSRHSGNKYGTGSFQNWRYLDPLPYLYRKDYEGTLSLPNYKLSTVCEHYGINISAHDAMSDIKATRELMKLISNS